MFAMTFNDKQFLKDMNNIVNYTVGFTDGIQKGKPVFLSALGATVLEGVKEFIDANARVNPAMLHHVYEWYGTGSPEARLFDITYSVAGPRIIFQNSFRQSQSVKVGSKEPFENKASIMENGQSLTIKPRESTVLRFEDNGEQVFTKSPVYVENPGGLEAVNGFERTFDLFFNKYFSQAFLKSSGLLKYLSTPLAYKTNLRSGKNGGRPVGISTGYNWIVAGGNI